MNLGHQAQSSSGTVEERHKQRENFPNTVVQMLCVEGVLARTRALDLGIRESDFEVLLLPHFQYGLDYMAEPRDEVDLISLTLNKATT